MAEQTISIRKIMDSALRHPLLQDLTLETAVDYAIDFMRIVGNPMIFENKVVELEVENYGTNLPSDYYQMVQVMSANGKAYRYATDSFHLDNDKRNTTSYKDLTYKIQGNVLITSVEKDTIKVSYLAIETDECGFPLIPDNSSFTRALEAYIKKQWFTILFDTGKISPQIFQQTLQDYSWAVGDCQTEFNRMSADKAESFYNSWKTMVVRDNEHSSGFINNGVKERLKIR